MGDEHGFNRYDEGRLSGWSTTCLQRIKQMKEPKNYNFDVIKELYGKDKRVTAEDLANQMNPNWMLKRIAKLEKALLHEKGMSEAFQIMLSEANAQKTKLTKTEREGFKKMAKDGLKRLKKIQGKQKELDKIPELEIAYKWNQK